MNIFSEKACFKNPVLPEKPVKQPAFNLSAGFFNKTWLFQALFRQQESDIFCIYILYFIIRFKPILMLYIDC
jgi:hypothetical protein